MRKSRFTTEQIGRVLQEWDAGGRPGELARRHGVTETTLYRWKQKYGGLQLTEAKRLKSLEEENRPLKRLVAVRQASVTSSTQASTLFIGQVQAGVLYRVTNSARLGVYGVGISAPQALGIVFRGEPMPAVGVQAG